MTTEWWSTSVTAQQDGADPPIPEPDPAPPPAPPAEEPPEIDTAAPQAAEKSRKMTAIVLGGTAAVILAGVLLLPDRGNEAQTDRPVAASSASPGDLPAAGAMPQTATAASPQEARSQQVSRAPAPAAVSLTFTPQKKGRVGAVVTVVIRNDTDEPVTVLASLVKGDGRAALVGEGTLAPGARTIQSGETAEGTVEFAASTTPQQVALYDLSGSIVTTSR